jgi:hypothetical protein
MRSNIDDVLKLVDGVVQAGGPLGWEDEESSAVVTVTISQEGVAGASSSPPTFEPSKEAWSLTVAPALEGKKFEEGPARATAHICATGDGVVTFVYPCDKEVQLIKDA